MRRAAPGAIYYVNPSTWLKSAKIGGCASLARSAGGPSQTKASMLSERTYSVDVHRYQDRLAIDDDLSPHTDRRRTSGISIFDKSVFYTRAPDVKNSSWLSSSFAAFPAVSGPPLLTLPDGEPVLDV